MLLKLCLFLVILSLPAWLACGPPDLATMVEQVKGGVVRIDTPEGNGTGVIFETDGDAALVVTNWHVLIKALQPYKQETLPIKVIVDDTIAYQGILKDYDAHRDLAVLSICCGDFNALSFGDVLQVGAGDEVITMGYPSGLPGSATVTRGIVSAIRRDRVGEVIQTDAPINPGNSGGPLLSPEGKVLGINTFGMTDAEGLGFAISARTVQAILPEIQGDGLLPVTATNTPATTRPRPTPNRRATIVTAVPAVPREQRQSAALPAMPLAPTPMPTPRAIPTPTSPPTPTFMPLPTPTPIPTATPLPTPTPTSIPIPTPTPYSTATPTPLPTPLPTATPTSLPTPTPEKFILSAISSGGQHTCGLRPNGTPVCGGRNSEGQAMPPTEEKLVAVSSGESHTCGLRPDHTPVCWGLNGAGQATPPSGEKFIAISSGGLAYLWVAAGWHTCLLGMERFLSSHCARR